MPPPNHIEWERRFTQIFLYPQNGYELISLLHCVLPPTHLTDDRDSACSERWQVNRGFFLAHQICALHGVKSSPKTRSIIGGFAQDLKDNPM